MRPKTARKSVPGALVLGICGCVALNDAPAQVATTIKTDASWGRAPSAVAPGGPSVVTANQARYAVSGNVYAIPQTLGKAAGANLFHSFETFSIGSGDAAVFTTTSSFNNVISRVSGTSPTSIQGLLALVPAAGSKPNFFLSIRMALHSDPARSSMCPVLFM